MANRRNRHKGPVHVRALPMGWQIRIEVPGGPNLSVKNGKLEDAIIALIGGVLDDSTGRLQALIRRLCKAEDAKERRDVVKNFETKWDKGMGAQ